MWRRRTGKSTRSKRNLRAFIRPKERQGIRSCHGYMFETAFAWRNGWIDGSNSGYNRVFSQPDEYQLARMYSGGLESAQTRVGREVCFEVSMLTLTSGMLKIAEVTSRIGDISAFISAIDAFGFRLDSKVLPAYLYEE